MNLDSLEFKLYAGELLAVIAFMIILFLRINLIKMVG